MATYHSIWSKVLVIAVMACIAGAAGAQEAAPDKEADLAKKLANPVASLISIPIQFNWDSNYGPNDHGKKPLRTSNRSSPSLSAKNGI